jgi:hypothetical protein
MEGVYSAEVKRVCKLVDLIGVQVARRAKKAKGQEIGSWLHRLGKEIDVERRS